MAIRFDEPMGAELADRSIRPLCFAADGDENYGLTMLESVAGAEIVQRRYMLGLQGTCTLIEYRSAYYVVFTRHQIARIPDETPEELNRRLDYVFVLMDDGRDSWNLPINGLMFGWNGQPDDEENDIVAASIEASMMTDFMRSQFFPVARTHAGRVGDQALCAGFPSSLQEVVMNVGGLRLQAICKTGEVIFRSPSSTGKVRYATDPISLDGMSGGAVYVARFNSNPALAELFETFLDGIIQRGGGGYVHYLSIERILDIIDHHRAD